MMYGHEKSDPAIVAVKPANKAKEAHCGGICGGGRSGVGGAKDGGQGKYAPAKHVLDSEPGSRVTGAGAYTARCAVIPPHVEYSERMALYVGERTFELRYMKGVHSEADTAIWLQKERVLYSASAFVSEQVNIFRPFVNISDILKKCPSTRAGLPRIACQATSMRPTGWSSQRNSETIHTESGWRRQTAAACDIIVAPGQPRSRAPAKFWSRPRPPPDIVTGGNLGVPGFPGRFRRATKLRDDRVRQSQPT
jgi:hypothetical protein